MHKLGKIKKINGKKFKAVHYSFSKKLAQKKAQFLRDHQGKNCRVIKHDKEWYIYKEMK